MAVSNYIKTIMEYIDVQSWQDTWIVDDVFPVSEKSGVDKKLSESGYWIKLVNVDDQVRVPVRYLLADKNLVSHASFISDDDGLLSSGRAFQVEWNHPGLKREYVNSHNCQVQNIWYLNDDTLASVNRNRKIEKAVEKEYKEIIDKVKNKVIPESDLISDLEFLQHPQINLHVMNVGQGDTIVLRFPGNRIWLIDAYLHSNQYKNAICESEFYDWLYLKYPEFFIERFIISHLHYDHIMSAQKIITTLQPNAVIFCHTPVGKTTTALKLLREASDRNILYELRGTESRTKSGFGFCLVAASNLANKANSSDQNHHGIIMDVVTKKSHLLLPGDAGWEQIDGFLGSKCNLTNKRTKYYKVTHHCSNTGYNAKFLSYYSPDYAYTSCSNGNRYGHPDQVTLKEINRLTNGSHVVTCEQKGISLDATIH